MGILLLGGWFLVIYSTSNVTQVFRHLCMEAIVFSFSESYFVFFISSYRFLMFLTGTGNIVVIMVSYPKGREILDLVQNGIPVKMTIGVGTRHVQEFISSQSVVFVAIAFIIMMIISLAWLIFYYIQRFLYTGSQFGSQVIMGNSF